LVVFFPHILSGKHFFDYFENIARDLFFLNLSIFEKSKHDLWKNANQFGQNCPWGSARTHQLHIHVAFEWLNFKSGEEIHFDWDPSNKFKIRFFDNAKSNPLNFQKLSLGVCSRSVRLIWAINHCYTLKTQGGDIFLKMTPSVL
jgi:hypothetical protein